MKTISTTVEYNGCPVKIEDGKVYLPAFGTTISNHSMHWSWIEVPYNDLKPELQRLLKEGRLI